ncbi:hypothetical protein JCM11641_007677 [Rhodosporidiobolus odoratus]
MKTAYLSLAASALFTTAVQAAGIVDMATVAVKLATQAIELNGDYYVQNVKTGEYMYFDRPGDTTNLITGSSKKTVTIGHDSKYGQSGVNHDTWSGSYFQGLDKCMSSQWGIENSVGIDIAAVSYACKVGDLASDGTDTLEVAKQFWHAVPCGSSSSSSSDDSADTSNIKLNAVVQSKSKSASTASWSSDDDEASSTSSAASSSQTRDPNDRTTWTCIHPGWWLARHPEYVWDQGKVECQDTLMSYYQSLGRMHKRSRTSKRALGFGENPNKLDKRGDTNYCMCVDRLPLYFQRRVELTIAFVNFSSIAVDHITDMSTRALTAEAVTTFGDYQSLKLVDYDSSDDAQHWKITKA